MTKLGHLHYSGIKKIEFMHEDPSWSAYSVSPASGQDNSFMYAVMPDKMEAAKYYYQAA